MRSDRGVIKLKRVHCCTLVVCFFFLLSLIAFPFLFTDIFKEGIWKETETFEDPYLQSLTSRLQTSVLSARAPATTNMYHRAFRKWMDFALSKLNISFLPAKPVHVAIYLQHVLESTNSSSSVDTAFYAIKWAHEIVGVASPTDNQVVSRVREAAKRILGAGRPNRKELKSSKKLWKEPIYPMSWSLETCVCTCYPMRVFSDLRRFLVLE